MYIYKGKVSAVKLRFRANPIYLVCRGAILCKKNLKKLHFGCISSCTNCLRIFKIKKRSDGNLMLQNILQTHLIHKLCSLGPL